jgi:hypothetical protein
MYHLAALVLAVIMGSFLFYYSEPADDARQLVKLVGGVLLVVWPLVVFLLSVLEKKHLADKTTLAKMYSVLLKRSAFLIISDLLLTIACIMLCWTIFTTRQVEFYTDEKEVVGIYVDKDNTPDDTYLGQASQISPLKVRMNTGKYLIYYKSRELMQATNIDVLPIYNTLKPNIFIVNYESNILPE